MANDQSLTLREMGSFYVAGYQPNETEFARAYVQYYIPADAGKRLPVLFVHGGGSSSGPSSKTALTGANWETTPDGRPGWIVRFLRAGWPCYIVDNHGRGRAIVGQLPGLWEGEGVAVSSIPQQAWDVFRIGPSDTRERRAPFPDSQFPLELLVAPPNPPKADLTPNVSASVATLVAAARRIGPCAIVAHSGGGRNSLDVAGIASDVVKASVIIEPHGAPDEGPTKGIGRQLLFGGDYLDTPPYWPGARKIWLDYVEKGKAAGAPVEYWELPDKGIRGNGHMMMMERNSDAIADLVMEWLAK